MDDKAALALIPAPIAALTKHENRAGRAVAQLVSSTPYQFARIFKLTGPLAIESSHSPEKEIETDFGDQRHGRYDGHQARLLRKIWHSISLH